MGMYRTCLISKLKMPEILNADNEPLRYRNPEGYSDPTAFFALRNVMKPTVLRQKPKAEIKHHPRTQVIHYD